MVMHLRSGAPVADKECFAHQIGPSDGGLSGESVPRRQCDDERFGPYPSRMTIGQFGRADCEHDVQSIGTKLHQGLAGCTLCHFDFDMRMVFAMLADQPRKEAARY